MKRFIGFLALTCSVAFILAQSNSVSASPSIDLISQSYNASAYAIIWAGEAGYSGSYNNFSVSNSPTPLSVVATYSYDGVSYDLGEASASIGQSSASFRADAQVRPVAL